MTSQEILDLPMDENDSGATTVREYLKALLRAVWTRKEGFNGKRPWGNGAWEYDVYRPLIKAGAAVGKLDSEGYIAEVDTKAADALIINAIEEGF